MCGKTKTTPSTFMVRHSTGVPSTGSVQGSNTLLFPWKLHDMLQTVEREGQDSIVSWLPDGKAFKVHDSTTFVNDIMPRHFKQTKYKSFQRQLNLWGFKRITKSTGPDKGAYSHPQFLRGQKSLCRHLCRQNNTTGSGSTSASAAAIKKDVSNDVKKAAQTVKMPKRPSPVVKTCTTSSTEPSVVRDTTLIPGEDVTHCSLLEMAIPTMMDLSTNEPLFPSFLDQDLQETTTTSTSMTEDDSALLFEGCQFFLLDELLSEEEWMEQEVKQVISTPTSVTAHVPAAITTSDTPSFNEPVTTVTPPSSPPHGQDEEDDYSASASSSDSVTGAFDADSLLPSFVSTSHLDVCVA